MIVEEEDVDDDGDISNGICYLMLEKLPPTGKILALSPRKSRHYSQLRTVLLIPPPLLL